MSHPHSKPHPLRALNGLCPARGLQLLLRAGMTAALLCAVGCGSAVAQQQRERELIRRDASAAALIERAEGAAAVGDLTRAEQYYVSAIAAGGQEKPLVQRLLRVCVADQRYPVAAEYAAQYLRRHPRDWDISFAAAAIHTALGQHEQAQRLLERVLQKRPRWPEAHYALASVLRERGEALDAADRHDLQYLQLRPEGPLAETARARLTRSVP